MAEKTIGVEDNPRAGRVAVKLDRTTFTLRTLTRSVRQARNAYDTDVPTLPDIPAVIECVGVLLDAILEPAPRSEKKPSDILTAKYEAEEWDEDQVLVLLNAIIEEQDAEDPT